MIRLVKVIVQPVLVEDDGETLTEVGADPMHVRPADLDGFPDLLRAQIDGLNTPDAPPG